MAHIDETIPESIDPDDQSGVPEIVFEQFERGGVLFLNQREVAGDGDIMACIQVSPEQAIRLHELLAQVIEEAKP